MPNSESFSLTHKMISIVPNHIELLINKARLSRRTFMIPITNIGFSMDIEAINVENGEI